MSARREESTRARIIDAANVLFASAVPNFSTSTSYFDIVATTDHHGIRARLLQWHRVGDTSLRCLLALVGPAKPSYREATPSSPTPRASSAKITAARSQSSRATSNSSTSTARPSTAPPGPGLTQAELLSPPPPMPDIPAHLDSPTPKRSLTTRLTPFLRRQREPAQQEQEPEAPKTQQQEQTQVTMDRTPSGQQNQQERKPSALHKLGSMMTHHRHHAKEPKTPPVYTLDPDQGPSPSPSPSPPKGRTTAEDEANENESMIMGSVGLRMNPLSPTPPSLSTMMAATTLSAADRPRGPRQLPPHFGERMTSNSSGGPHLRATTNTTATRNPARTINTALAPAALRVSGLNISKANSSNYGVTRLQRKPVAAATALQPSQSGNSNVTAGSSVAAAAPSSSNIWDDVDDFLEELIAAQEADRIRLQRQEQERQLEEQQRQAQLRQELDQQRVTWQQQSSSRMRDGGENNGDNNGDGATLQQHSRSAARRHHLWPKRSFGSRSEQLRSNAGGDAVHKANPHRA
ncbi:hypothetical protein BFW01_g10866 [Lasiodiplodia theobromae]|uniref:Uncharacterized protein n=1 Tax=Lasiodiplodia theobromae TaxID=45133 RepID=A0A8H7MAL0_9PEZI|nr:hypothetical protein BFW01_g10866 [Lasiodiplodia theobromae]